MKHIVKKELDCLDSLEQHILIRIAVVIQQQLLKRKRI